MDGAATGQVFFAVLVRDPRAGKDAKRRAHLEFQFTRDLTAGDVIEAVSQHVKQHGGRTATSRRSSVVLVYDIESKQLVAAPDRSAKLITHRSVRASLAAKGSIALLIDDHREGRGSFESARATPQLLRHPTLQAAIQSPKRGGQSASSSAAMHSPPFSPRLAASNPSSNPVSPPSAPAATMAPGSTSARAAVWPERSPSPLPTSPPAAAEEVVRIDPTPHETARALLDAEMSSLRTTRQALGYPHWVDLLPRTPPTYKRWMKSLERERDAVAAHRQALTQSVSSATAEAASITAECERVEKDTRDFEAACLQRARDFDRRALLQSRLDDLRATVKDQAAAEKKLLEEIEQCYVANAATAAGHPAPQSAERSASAPAAETQRDEPVAARSGPPPVWPSFQEREKSQQGAGEPEPPKRPTSYGFEPEGPEAQALRISALWGCTPEDLLPADRKPAAPESPRPEINHLSPVPASSSSPPQVRRSLSPNSGPGAVASDTPDLDSGLSLLPPDLTHDVRELLSHAPRSASRSPAVVTDVSRSPGTRPADRSSSATATAGDGSSSSSSSIAMRLLAADLDAFLTTDGADAQTRHALLLRVQELRERISSRRRQ